MLIVEVEGIEHAWMIEGGPTVTIPVGAYIVSENSQGFVDVSAYDSERLALVDFDYAAARYSGWMNGDDDFDRDDGVSGQDRESYTDNQDRESYTESES